MDEEDDAAGGTPKKIKQDPDALNTAEKLYACPYCKHDRTKYSELNLLEKQYRGCSSGYWPDISRLKQHLYRVHWRRFPLHSLLYAIQQQGPAGPTPPGRFLFAGGVFVPREIQRHSARGDSS